ncbi:hypothetical protein BT96DRAFT_994661 [Gymnopus androsaceus JB14]|uniref:Uncharacterized protein n=1 Tax=Gymnopus androsaceus JB14 TaxID=1447944 RepID=A0A6A4HMH0_9AGAR|nr:hypothetical protein BT96DRAFT_994661 [Gymnopus androsaceus JB14]
MRRRKLEGDFSEYAAFFIKVEIVENVVYEFVENSEYQQQPNYSPSSFDFQATSPLERVRKVSAGRNDGNRPPAVKILLPNTRSLHTTPNNFFLFHLIFTVVSGAARMPLRPRGMMSTIRLDMSDFEDPREIFARGNARDSFDSNIYNKCSRWGRGFNKGSGSALRDSCQSGPIHAHTGRPSILESVVQFRLRVMVPHTASCPPATSSSSRR